MQTIYIYIYKWREFLFYYSVTSINQNVISSLLSSLGLAFCTPREPHLIDPRALRDGPLQDACGDQKMTNIIIAMACQSISAHFNRSRDCPNSFRAPIPRPHPNPTPNIMILISTNNAGFQQIDLL